jgi:hypothetical protein
MALEGINEWEQRHFNIGVYPQGYSIEEPPREKWEG